MSDQAPAKTRKIFSWAAVPMPLKRQLVAVSGKSVGGRPESALTADLWARYGARPGVAAFSRGAMGAVLLEHWIPTLTQRELEEIESQLSHVDRQALRGRSKADKVAYLRKRNITESYRVILRDTFLARYRVDQPVATGGTRVISLPAVEEFIGANANGHELHTHQVEAHAALDAAITLNRRRTDTGLLVLPTGSGKTFTAVRWLVDRALSQGIRVLWLAHQRELLLQARNTFRSTVATMGPETRYRSRLIVTGAGSINTLAADDTDIAFVSLPTLATRFDKAKKLKLETFLERPAIVIVDEAHHGGAQTYYEVLKACRGAKPVAVIGLTATPWPQALMSRARFHDTFATTYYEAAAEKLTEEGILARPVVHTVETDEVIELTDDEARRNEKAPDITDDVLARLDSPRRNRIVVTAYREHQELFGKCLVFAANIAHADRLHAAFHRAGVPVRVVHGETDTHRGESIAWFEAQSGPAVLVSVRMLTEGVDLPSADSVILARPTTSRILLRQMIGRALRGPRSGGAPEAHIVNIRDEWANLSDVLEPPEVIELPDVEHRRDRRRPGRAGDPWELLPIVDEDGQDLSASVEAEGERLFTESRDLIEPDGRALSPEERQRFRNPTVRLTTARLAGWYRLADRNVTVFDHQLSGFESLIAKARYARPGEALMSEFDDLPPPWPSARALRDIVEHVRTFGPPEFHQFNDQSLPWIVAQELAQGARTEADVAAHVLRRWQSGAIRLQMSLLEYEEAVDEERRRLRRKARGDAAGLEPEDAGPPSPSPTDRTRMPRAQRDLNEVMKSVVAWMRDETPHLAERLTSLPTIAWTAKPIGTRWGYWTLRTYGKGRGKASIRINRLLATKTSIVSDEMLGYLVYHELLHHVLSTRGHDVGFRNYEAKWPNAARRDAAYDTLHERYATDPKLYR